jgi:hypothetical protein
VKIPNEIYSQNHKTSNRLTFPNLPIPKQQKKYFYIVSFLINPSSIYVDRLRCAGLLENASLGVYYAQVLVYPM